MESIIATNIRKFIKDNGYIQGAVADRAGINRKTFNNMLNNRKIISDRDILPIAKALNVTPNDLFATDITQDSAGKHNKK